jgi:hypothetical protein
MSARFAVARHWNTATGGIAKDSVAKIVEPPVKNVTVSAKGVTNKGVTSGTNLKMIPMERISL